MARQKREEPTKQLNTRILNSLDQRLEALCRGGKMNKRQLIETAIRLHLERVEADLLDVLA